MASKTSESQGIPDVFQLDEQKLQSSESSEKQELYLLQWLAQVERECKVIDPVSFPSFFSLRCPTEMIAHRWAGPT